ncbi:MAG: hypothetical protein ABI441_10375 [Flavobacterium sp.]
MTNLKYLIAEFLAEICFAYSLSLGSPSPKGQNWDYIMEFLVRFLLSVEMTFVTEISKLYKEDKYDGNYLRSYLCDLSLLEETNILVFSIEMREG